MKSGVSGILSALGTSRALCSLSLAQMNLPLNFFLCRGHLIARLGTLQPQQRLQLVIAPRHICSQGYRRRTPQRALSFLLNHSRRQRYLLSLGPLVISDESGPAKSLKIQIFFSFKSSGLERTQSFTCSFRSVKIVHLGFSIFCLCTDSEVPFRTSLHLGTNFPL